MEKKQRLMRSVLAHDNLHTIQAASHRYTWRDIPCIKNPFDFALYYLLVWHIKPKTIIEIGSHMGGSALWLADMLKGFGLNGHIVSVDLKKVTNIEDPRINFLAGDANNLGDTLSDEYMATLEHPWLVIEDSSHNYRTCLHVLRFFDRHLEIGEYLVVEDGIIDDLGLSEIFDGGPNRAIREFIENCGGRYKIDTGLCDFFGHNMTWNTNGYLRKIS